MQWKEKFIDTCNNIRKQYLKMALGTSNRLLALPRPADDVYEISCIVSILVI